LVYQMDSKDPPGQTETSSRPQNLTLRTGLMTKKFVQKLQGSEIDRRRGTSEKLNKPFTFQGESTIPIGRLNRRE